MPARFLVPFLIPAFLLSAFCVRPVLAEEIRIEARRIELQGRSLEAEGEVRFTLGLCTLQADGAHLTPPTLEVEQACLQAGKIRLTAYRLTLGPNGRLLAMWPRGWWCLCPGARPLIQLSARRAWVAAHGRRLWLSWPSLWIGTRRFVLLPFAALPLVPGVSGLLLPEVSWSGRDGVRLEQGLYVSNGRRVDLLLAGGWIQHRGPTSRVRGRLWQDPRGEGELSLMGLKEEQRFRGSIQGNVSFGGSGWAMGLVPDLVSDGAFPSDLEREADRVFAPYLRSRFWTWASAAPLFALVQADLMQDLTSPLRRSSSLGGQVEAALGLLPAPLWGPFFLQATASMVRRMAHFSPTFAEGSEWDATSNSYLQITELAVDPALSFLEAAGPFRFAAKATSHHVGVWSPVEDRWRRIQGIHLGALVGEASLPLLRNFGAAADLLQHRLEPVVSLAMRAGVIGQDPDARFPDGEAAAKAQILGIGLRTSVLRGNGASRQLLRGEGRLEISLPSSSSTLQDGRDAWAVEVVATPLANISLWSSARVRERRLAALQGHACLRWGPLRPCAGYARMRLTQMEELLDLGHGLWLPLAAARVLPLRLELDHLYGGIRLRLSNLESALRLTGDPLLRRMTQGSFFLNWSFSCGCYRLGVEGSYQSGQRWPDLLLRLSLSGERALRCSIQADDSSL
jgi:hypothetical protein